MKLVSVIENIADEYGGPANSLPNMLEALRAELSVKSAIYSIAACANEKNEFINRFGIQWINCKQGGGNKLKYSSELKNRLESDLSDDDVLFSNNLWNYPSFLAAKTAQKCNVPHIISIRGTLYPWSLAQGKLRKKVAWLLFQKKALQQASLIHVTCSDEYKAVRGLGVRSPIAIVPHGINYDDYQQLPDKKEAIKTLGLNPQKKYVLFMSRLHKKKGLDLLLETWLELVKIHPDWCLLVVGPDYGGYMDKISSLASDNHIQVLGMLTGEEKKCAFSSSEFFVLPSYTENFGVVIGEALAAGLPVITTKGTPWSEINTYNCGEYITLSKEKLIQALQGMMSLDTESLIEMSINGKLLIRNNYSWAAQAVKFGKALEFVLTGKVPPNIVYLMGDSPS